MHELERHGISAQRAADPWDFSRDSGFGAAARLLDQGLSFTGLFCANDEMAVGAIACFQRGISVPQHVSVIGYDDDYSAELACRH
jgi:LacI family transcriptional regulator